MFWVPLAIAGGMALAKALSSSGDEQKKQQTPGTGPQQPATPAMPTMQTAPVAPPASMTGEIVRDIPWEPQPEVIQPIRSNPDLQGHWEPNPPPAPKTDDEWSKWLDNKRARWM